MKSSLQGPAGKPAESNPASPAPDAPVHRDTWGNRATVRGRVLTPLTIVVRATREGTRGDCDTGSRAAHHQRALIQRWIEEDRAAGRMDWPTYLRLRYSVGFDPL